MNSQQKLALVTGAAGGIGRAIALALRADGATVIAADLREGEDLPEGVHPLIADISTTAGVAAMLQNAQRNFGPVDIFVGNAGLAFEMDAQSSEADWARMMDVNLMAHVRAARLLLPDLAQRGGRFVVTASAAGLLNEVRSLGYGVSKHAALGFAEWLAFTYRAEGLKVHCLCPEGVRTSMIEFSPYLEARAVPPEAAAEALIEAMRAERFMVTTHDSTLKGLAVKASDYEKYLAFMEGVSRAER